MSNVHPTAVIDAGARVAAGACIWHFCHVMADADIGEGCILGQNVFVGRGVHVGAGSKIQNNVSLYQGVRIGKGCFVGPSAVFTNVKTPRAEVSRKDAFAPTNVLDGATIGANATIVCGVTLGEDCFVAAGAVVTADALPHALVAGCPARRIGWACSCGRPLSDALSCICGRSFEKRSDGAGLAEKR